MADNRIQFTFEINDRGQVKVDKITKGFVKMDTAIKKVSASLNQQAAAARGSNTAMSSTISNAGLAGATLTELGRTISDFNYGIRGMANNLSQLSMLFITLASKQERGGFAGFRLALSQLGKQLMGPLGIILAFQTLLTVLESFALSSEKAAKGTKSLIDEFKELTKIQLDRDQRIILQGQNVLNQLELEEQQLEKIKEIGESRIVGQDKYGRDIIRTIAFQNLSLEEQERIEKRLLKIQEDRFDTQAQIDAAIERQENKKKKGTGRAGGKGDELIPGTIAYYENEIKLLLAIQKLKVTTPEQFKAIEAEILKYEKLIEDLMGLKREVAESVLVTETPEKKSVLIAKKALDEGQANRKKDLDDFIATEKKRVDEVERAEKLKANAIKKSKDIHLAAQTDLINGLAALGEKNKELAIAAIVAEKLITIASIIGDTRETNMALRAAGTKAGGVKGFFGVEALIAMNNVASGISIAATAASAAAAIRGVRTGQDQNIGGLGSSGGARATTTGGPTFNVVGASQFSQLAQAVEGRDEPIRAYVVAGDITNAQQLENNVSNAASI